MTILPKQPLVTKFNIPQRKEKESINHVRNEKPARLPMLPLTFPRVRAIQHTLDYKISKDEEKNHMHTTHWEVARHSSSLQLTEAKRLLRRRKFNLKFCREQARHKRILFDNGWDDLERRQLTLRSLFKRFNFFFRENQEKRDRACKKASEELMLQDRRSTDINNMRKSIAETNQIKHLMEKTNKEHKLYEDYLDTVVKASGFYKNVNELLSRYASLVETKTILSQKQECGLGALEAAHANMLKLVEEKRLYLVGLQNQVAGLQERYDLAYVKCLQWEHTVTVIQDIYADEGAKIVQVKSSIDYTYKEMCKRKNADATIPAENYEERLKFIKKTLSQLYKVVGKLVKYTYVK